MKFVIVTQWVRAYKDQVPPDQSLASSSVTNPRTKPVATVRLRNGSLRKVELHWYEAHGIGKRDVKIKRYLDE